MTQEVFNKVDEIQAAVKEMRDTNDANQKKYDVILNEKTDRINTDITKMMEVLDTLQKRANRTQLTTKDNHGRDVELTDEEVAHKQGWVSWARGKSDDSKLADLQRKSPYTKLMQTGDDTAGGYFVPREIDNTVLTVQQNLSPMRQVARVISLSTPDYVQFVNKRGATANWVGETETRAETNTPVFGAITPYMGELEAMPKATQQMLDDSSFDIESFLAGEIAEQFAITEGTAFLTGNGVKKPLGLLGGTISVTVDASLTFGTIGAVKTGVNGAFATASGTTSPADVFYTAIGELKPVYRTGMKWMFNRKAETAVRTMKDGQDNYLWSLNNFQSGFVASLVGIPYVLNEDCANYTTTGANAILLGNFERCYTIVDRIGIRTLRDPYTSKPYVLFYSTKRIGGMITDTYAVKVIQFAA